MSDLLGNIAAALWGPWTFYTVLTLGVIATIGTKFVQLRILTHGVGVITGKYDRADDPGAISHFQALSAALSATVGLGNIGGVALAIAIGGPGALFWMWIVAIFGMALKAVEITLAMIYRDTSDSEHPRGGSMWVIQQTLGKRGKLGKYVATVLATVFAATTILQVFTGGNIFQIWNVATLAEGYFRVPQLVTSVVIAVLVALVVVGGIRRIGEVTSKLVPAMVALYIVSGLIIIGINIGEVPEMLGLVFRSAFAPAEAGGAFVGAGIYFAFSMGMRRAIFSNEAGQGTAPMVHAAARTDHAAREGVVGGLGPFIDTIVICTLTALVILISGAWNHPGLEPAERWGEVHLAVVSTDSGDTQIVPGHFDSAKLEGPAYTMALRELPERERGWEAGDEVFFIVNTNGEKARREGSGGIVRLSAEIVESAGGDLVLELPAATLSSNDWREPPSVASMADGRVHLEREGAELTAMAWDTHMKGWGRWVVALAALLFSVSTVITYAFYGEVGLSFFTKSPVVLGGFKYVYILCAAAAPLLVQDVDMLIDIIDVGTGSMMWANIPILFITGMIGIKEINRYFSSGEWREGGDDSGV